MKSNLARLVCLVIVMLAATALVHSQEKIGTPPAPPATSTAPPASSEQSGAAPRTSVDETFDLNITERRIVEHNFQASTAIEAGDENTNGVNLRIGVGVGAEEIDVLLRNVRGHVRFRGTLTRILERINARHNANASSSTLESLP